MPKHYLIGIDPGSSSVKTSLFDSEGRACGDVMVGCSRPWQPRACVP